MDGKLWAGKLHWIKHLNNRLVTVNGLDFGIPAEMTAFLGLTRLVYSDKSFGAQCAPYNKT